VRCFSATYENKKFERGAFVLSTLPPHLNFAQITFSVELCINKLSAAAAKSDFKANCEKFDSELRELRTPDGLADLCVLSVMAFWKGTERLAN